MYRDEFKSRYTTIPLATFSRRHTKDTLSEDLTTLSHVHKEMELLAITKGTARFLIDSRAYDVKKGDVLIICPYMFHNATIYADQEFAHYCLCFDLKMIPDQTLCSDLEFRRKRIDCLFSDSALSQQLGAHIESIFNVHSGQRKGWELQVQGYLSLIMGLLEEHDCVYSVNSNSNTNDINYRIVDYIDKHYEKNISSADLASALFISKSYLCRVFKRNFGCHFQEYLCLYRIEKAKRLLLTTRKPIADIAMEVGFSSFSYFSKMFKAQMQKTPSEYRRSMHP